jgi:hypothetical protein
MGDAWLEHATSCLRGKSGQTIRRESAWSRAISPLTRAETTGNHRVLPATGSPRFGGLLRRVDASKEEETVLPGDPRRPHGIHRPNRRDTSLHLLKERSTGRAGAFDANTGSTPPSRMLVVEHRSERVRCYMKTGGTITNFRIVVLRRQANAGLVSTALVGPSVRSGETHKRA